MIQYDNIWIIFNAIFTKKHHERWKQIAFTHSVAKGRFITNVVGSAKTFFPSFNDVFVKKKILNGVKIIYI